MFLLCSIIHITPIIIYITNVTYITNITTTQVQRKWSGCSSFLAGSVFFKVKMKFHFYKKQVANKQKC